MVGQFQKAYLHRPIKTFSQTRKKSNMFNITSKYFCFFNNTPPAKWVVHITRDFLTYYSCSYYSSMPYIVLLLEWCCASTLLHHDCISITSSTFKIDNLIDESCLLVLQFILFNKQSNNSLISKQVSWFSSFSLSR